ncbi:MAG: site-specific DNA-methyltransferase, partial [Endomicrobium sp.]|nr:site-specific DNA-methyltransferase [Endomicrobium sp.]
GSLYRSQHELIFVYKNGDLPHTNNIELGVHGRYRTNVWDYPGIFINNKLNKSNLKLHPTVKPIGLIADIIKDASKRNEIVLDCFGGSGSTLLAAERTGRKAYLIEIDTEYCDIIIHRYQTITGKKAKLLNRIEEI